MASEVSVALDVVVFRWRASGNEALLVWKNVFLVYDIRLDVVWKMILRCPSKKKEKSGLVVQIKQPEQEELAPCDKNNTSLHYRVPSYLQAKFPSIPKSHHNTHPIYSLSLPVHSANTDHY